jgi:hypothetical protein
MANDKMIITKINCYRSSKLVLALTKDSFDPAAIEAIKQLGDDIVRVEEHKDGSVYVYAIGTDCDIHWNGEEVAHYSGGKEPVKPPPAAAAAGKKK